MSNSDDEGSRTVTIPEVTVEGDAEAGRAYNDGYALGATHDGAYDPISHGMQHTNDYNQGVVDGNTDATSQTNAPTYDGPSIGPEIPGGRPYAEVEEEQRRQLEWVTGHEDPHTHGEGEPGEPPEPNLPTLVE